MKVRKPDFDFSGVHPHWSPNIEFAQARNATSVKPSHIEPFLLKILRKVKSLLAEPNPPFYDPAEKKTPPGMYEYLDQFPEAPGNTAGKAA